jgi:DNA primase
LLSLAAQAGARLRKTGNGWHAGPCPFCGGTDRFVLHLTSDGWRWLCRNCGDGKYHDVIAFYQKWRGCDFRAAVAELGNVGTTATTPSAPPPKRTTLPDEHWQKQAREVIEQCASYLWMDAGAKARTWLNERGLTDETLRRWQIGYCPGGPGEWRKMAGLSVPCGVVIPGIVGDSVWYVKVRRATGEPKYIQVKGSGPALFGADTVRGQTIAVFCEGEFDAMLTHQEARDLCGVLTLGSASDPLDVPAWAGYLLPIVRLLVAYDVDAAGDKGAAKLLSLTRRAQRLAVPKLREGDKDVTDFHKSGGNVREWLAQAVGAQDDDELLDAVLGWAESHGYEPTFGPDGHILMNRGEL